MILHSVQTTCGGIPSLSRPNLSSNLTDKVLSSSMNWKDYKVHNRDLRNETSLSLNKYLSLSQDSLNITSNCLRNYFEKISSMDTTTDTSASTTPTSRVTTTTASTTAAVATVVGAGAGAEAEVEPIATIISTSAPTRNINTTVSKTVVFADEIGQELYTVKYINPLPKDYHDELGALANFLTSGNVCSEHATSSSSLSHRSTSLFSPSPHNMDQLFYPEGHHWSLQFTQPASQYVAFREALENRFVSLENLTVENGGEEVRGTVKVRNTHFEKHVFLRFTFDHWKCMDDVSATYQPCGDVNPRFDTFVFSFPLNCPSQGRVCLELAVCYQTPNGEFWDNNAGKNYVLIREAVLESRGEGEEENGNAINTTRALFHSSQTTCNDSALRLPQCRPHLNTSNPDFQEEFTVSGSVREGYLPQPSSSNFAYY